MLQVPRYTCVCVKIYHEPKSPLGKLCKFVLRKTLGNVLGILEESSGFLEEGVDVKEVALMTKIAITAETAQTVMAVSSSCICKTGKGGQVAVQNRQHCINRHEGYPS